MPATAMLIVTILFLCAAVWALFAIWGVTTAWLACGGFQPAAVFLLIFFAAIFCGALWGAWEFNPLSFRMVVP